VILPPPPLHALPAGYQLAAGLSHSTVLPDIDFETRSEAGFVWSGDRWVCLPNASQGKKGLPVVGAAHYAEHPTAQITLCAYDLKDGKGRRRWRIGQPPPADLHAHVQAGGLLEAVNVGFEAWCWANIAVPQLGWPPVPPEQWRCAAAKARAHALPGSLADMGRVLGVDVQKDPRGKRLIQTLTVPRDPTADDPRTWIEPMWSAEDVEREATRWLPVITAGRSARAAAGAETRLRARLAENVQDWSLFAEYNEQDIAAEAEASALVPDLSPDELRFWQDDQRINRRGVRIDTAAIEDCVEIIRQAERRYGDELRALTGGLAPTQVAKLTAWLHDRGVHMDSLDEEHVEAALARDMPADARRALEIRAAMGSASIKKVFAMRNMVTRAGRLHDLYTFHGARTGRPTGSGPQPTNLPKAGPHVYRCGTCGHYHGAHTMWCPWCFTLTVRAPGAAREWNPDAVEDALRAISYRSLDYLETAFGDALLAVAGVLRGLFIAAEGHDMVSSDFTAIEGVVMACLTGEQWRIDAFVQDRSLYVESASRAFNIPIEVFEKHKAETGQHHPMRQIGKGMELGLQFAGWVNALRQFGVEGTDDELKEYVLAWRGASPNIVEWWGGQSGGPGARSRWEKRRFGLEGAAINDVENPGTEFHVHRLDGARSGVSYLTRGDALYCRTPSGGLITYHRPRLAAADQEWRGLSLSFEGWNTNPKSGPTGWLRMGTYSGKLAENVVQKTARDIQMNAIARCERLGYPIVMHTYDEVVAEVPHGVGSVEELESIMTTPMPWSEGWPIKAAGGWRGRRYRKA